MEHVKQLTAAQWGTLWKLADAANIDPAIADYCREMRDGGYKAEHDAAEAKCNAGACTDEDLEYAATARCPCGAGLAYHKGIGVWGFWDCSDILTGRAKKKGEPGSVQHTYRLPFNLYDVKSERQPSAQGATTRPRRPEAIPARVG